MNKIFLSLIASSVALAAGTATAQVRTEKNISSALAQEIATETVNACSAKGYNVTATVVDRAGLTRSVLRADNAGPHTLSASYKKAYTSASARNNTSAILETVQKTPASQYLPEIEGFLVLGGGVPIRSGNDVIGAVGVGGAPGGHLDEQCAVAALDKVKDKLQ
ncbi:MAG: heme-binding protein [Moraxellaceae bacterium]|nr:heme-binding protein [Moraxellaceae bacterium]